MRIRLPLERKHQRGAILIMTAAFIVAAVALLALAVDTGRLYAAQQKLQSAANLAALDSARQLSGCHAERTAAAIKSDIDNAINGKNGTLKNNGLDGVASATTTLGNLITQDNLRKFTVDFTDIDDDPLEADTVRVSLSRQPPKPLLGMLTKNQTPLRATAAATQKPVGALTIASSLANIDTAKSKLLNGLLSGLLGTAVNLNVVDYRDLAQADVTLLGLLKTSTQAANVDDLLGLALRPGQLLQMIASASGPAGAPLDTIGKGLNSNDTLKLGNLLNLEAGSEQVAAQVPLNALGLVMALAETSAANRGDVISVGPSALDPLLDDVSNLLPGIVKVELGLNLKLGIVEPPQSSAIGRAGFDNPGAGRNQAKTGSVPSGPGKAPAAFAGARTWASTSQINLNLDATVHVKILGLVLDLDVPLYLAVAKSYSILNQIDCATATNPMLQAHTLTSPGILELGIGHFDNIHVPDPQANVDPNAKLLDLKIRKLLLPGYHDLLGLKLPENPIKATTSPPKNATQQTFNGPFVPQINSPSGDNTQPVSAEAVEGVGDLLGQALGGVTDYIVDNPQFTGVLGNTLLNPVIKALNALGVPSLVNVVTNVVTSLISGLGNVLDPLLQALGVSVGNAYVTINAVVPQQPTLICTSSGKPNLGDCKSVTAPPADNK